MDIRMEINMENKIGYAYISLEEYKELIEENTKLSYLYDEIKEQEEKLEKNFISIENNIFGRIYESEKYYIRNYDGIGNYYHNQLVIAFQKYGYISLDKINELIQKLVEKYKNEEDKVNKE